MSRDDVRLLHIRDALRRIRSYAADRATFMSTPMVQDAVIRNLEIIGEAVKALDVETRSRGPQVPWNRIAALRDRLIHGYFTVDLDLVWEVVDDHLPVLERAIQEMLAPQSGS